MRLSLFASLCASALAAAPAAAGRPNLLLILADDLEIDFKQDRLAIMPHLRRLVSRGTSFTNAVASTPVCGPSRATLLSGRYAHNHGYLANEDGPSLLAWLAAQDVNLGAWLTAAGYRSAYHGKYVNGLVNKCKTVHRRGLALRRRCP
jgi:arylsulfatase A-like enzyme